MYQVKVTYMKLRYGKEPLQDVNELIANSPDPKSCRELVDKLNDAI